MSNSKLDQEALIYGDKQIQVTDRSGQKHTLKVKAIANRDFPKYGELILGDEASLAELLTGQEAKFIDNLTDESIYLINDTGKEITDPRFALWTKRQAHKAQEYKPLIKQRAKILQEALESSRQTTAESPEQPGSNS